MRALAQRILDSSGRVFLLVGVAAFATLILTTACKDEKPAPAPAAAEPAVIAPAAVPEGVRDGAFVTADELARLEAKFMADVERHRTMACKRPPLRGAALPGRADDDIVAVAEASTPETKACDELAEQHRDELTDWLRAPDGPAPPAVQQVSEACAALDAAVRRAVSHEDSCSPYLVGRRGAPFLIRLVRFGNVVAARSLLRARSGDVGGACDLLTDWLRYTQDLSRGDGAPLIVNMVAVGAAAPAFDALGELIAGATASDRAALSRLQAELQQLAQTDVGFAGMLEAERLWMTSTGILPEVKGEGWAPPGGWGEDHARGGGPGLGEVLPGESGTADYALLWAAYDTTMKEVTDACPRDASLKECQRGLAALRAERAKKPKPTRMRTLLSVLGAKEPRKALRKAIEDLLATITDANWARYVPRLASRRYLLAAARVHVAVALGRLDGAPCPDAATLRDGAAWASLRVIPDADAALEFEDASDGAVLMKGGGWLTAGDDRLRSYRMRCR